MTDLKSISLRGSSVAYLDQGDGPPLLFVHGFPLSSSMWLEQFSFFSDRFRVLCPDLPGFGASDSLDGSTAEAAMTMEFFADWLVHFLDAVDCELPVNFCGLSMGGYIGWQFWKRHRSRLSSLIACNTRAANDTDLIRRGREIAARQVLVTGAVPVADTMVKKLFYQKRSNLASLPFHQKTHNAIAATSPKSIAAGHRGMGQREDASHWISEIDVPTLFVAGEHDLITPADEMQADSNRVAVAEYVLIKDAGHMSPLEQPTAFNEAIATFLQSHA